MSLGRTLSRWSIILFVTFLSALFVTMHPTPSLAQGPHWTAAHGVSNARVATTVALGQKFREGTRVVVYRDGYKVVATYSGKVLSAYRTNGPKASAVPTQLPRGWSIGTALVVAAIDTPTEISILAATGNRALQYTRMTRGPRSKS